MPGLAVERVVVHPLVLLSIVDNYNRAARDVRARVVGVLLGEARRGRVDVTNSYAVPFEEDERSADIWFLDHNYHEAMLAMFKKINAIYAPPRAPPTSAPRPLASAPDGRAMPGSIGELPHATVAAAATAAKEHVVGWYSTGPKLRESDLDIHELILNSVAGQSDGPVKPETGRAESRAGEPHCTQLPEQRSWSYCANPVLVIIDVQPKELGIPTKAYCAVEEVKEDGTQKSQKAFVHIASEIGAYEAEEIGVEHLLRDVKDSTISTLASEVSAKMNALKGLESRLKEIQAYLNLVVDGKLPVNHEIMYHLQDVFNLLPNLNVQDLVTSFAVKTNDMMLVIYLSSLIRSVILNKEHERTIDDAAAPSAITVAGS
eukprot:SM000028S10046  [mRNA]  locus=s28:73567:76368:- [translate_table: standard]